MKLRVVMGRAGSGKTHLCLEEIRRKLLAQPEGAPLVLLLPEHATYQVERELAATPGLQGFIRAHVLGFRRLSYRVLQETGGAARPQLDELGKTLLVTRLLRQLEPQLRSFGRAARQRGFAMQAMGLLEECKTYRLPLEALQAAAQTEQQQGRTLLADKLHDLALLYTAFSQSLQECYHDAQDRMTLLAERAQEAALLRGCEVWADGFAWFNPQELAVLGALLPLAKEVTVTLCLDGAELARYEAETSLFHRQWRTREDLRRLAAQLGAQYEEVNLEKRWRFDSAALQLLEERFFRFPVRPLPEAPQGVVLAEAANGRAEAAGIARDMLRLAREEGWRWRDIAVLVRDDDYRDWLEEALTDHGIPYFSDQPRQAQHHPLAELIRSALEVVMGNWGYESVFRCLKTDFFSLERAAVDKLENYVLCFGLRGRRWTQEEPWRYWRRLALAEEDEGLDEASQEELACLDNWRRQAAQPLAELELALGRASTVRAQATALFQFLERLEAPLRLEEWAQRAEELQELDEALEHRQFWGQTVALLEQLVEVLGDESLPPEEFAALLQEGLDAMTLSLVPPGLDHVVLATLGNTSLANVKAVYLPGVNEGALPRRARDEGLLSDSERRALRGAGLELAPGAQADMLGERFLVYTALSRSCRYLWLSYALADAEGKSQAPSLIVRRLRELWPQLSLQNLPLDIPVGEEASYAVQPEQALAALPGVLRRYRETGELAPAWREVYNWGLRCRPEELRRYLAGLFHDNRERLLPPELAQRLFLRGQRLSGSVTRFEAFQACPFRHFARYGLGLRQRSVFRLAAPDLGQFLHASLKEYGERLAAKGQSWAGPGEEERVALCEEVVNALAPRLQNEILLSSGQHRHLLRRLGRTVRRAAKQLSDFAAAGSFKTCWLEQCFGHGEQALPPLTFRLPGGQRLDISGQIDRVDSAEQEGLRYLLVIDYKSGKAGLNLDQIYYGLRLQLLTYLLVALEAGRSVFGQECLPAGMLYYFLQDPAVSGEGPKSEAEIEAEVAKKLKLPGWTLQEPQVSRLLDASIEGSWSKFLSISLKKDGDYHPTCLRQVRSAEQFGALLLHARTVLQQTGAAILEGQVTPAPYELEGQSPCLWCEYRSVCQFDRAIEGQACRLLKKMNEDEVWLRLLPTERENQA